MQSAKGTVGPVPRFRCVTACTGVEPFAPVTLHLADENTLFGRFALRSVATPILLRINIAKEPSHGRVASESP